MCFSKRYSATTPAEPLSERGEVGGGLKMGYGRERARTDRERKDKQGAIYVDCELA